MMSIATAYLPYIAFIGVNNIYEALLLTMVIPLGTICFFGSAKYEDLYYYLGISYYEKSDESIDTPNPENINCTNQKKK